MTINELFPDIYMEDSNVEFKGILSKGKDKNGKEETKCPNKHRYTSMPAGEKDVYELLQQYERVCMEDIFVENYINVAVKEVPESLQKLYGIYYNFFK